MGDLRFCGVTFGGQMWPCVARSRTELRTKEKSTKTETQGWIDQRRGHVHGATSVGEALALANRKANRR